MDFLDCVKEFLDNGGFLGYLNGFDAKKEGRVYNFGDLKKDIEDATVKVKEIGNSLANALELEVAV